MIKCNKMITEHNRHAAQHRTRTPRHINTGPVDEQLGCLVAFPHFPTGFPWFRSHCTRFRPWRLFHTCSMAWTVVVLRRCDLGKGRLTLNIAATVARRTCYIAEFGNALQTPFRSQGQASLARSQSCDPSPSGSRGRRAVPFAG